MASSVTVANRFLELAEASRNPLTPMQLLKLVYIAHGWMLGLHGRPLISDPVEAWQYGPVIPVLYGHVRNYRGAAITSRIHNPSNNADLDESEGNVVEQVFTVYGKFTGLQLSRMTHADGTPWAQTYTTGSFGKVIPVDLIEDHYRQLAERKAA